MPARRSASALFNVTAVALVIACAAILQMQRHAYTGPPPAAASPVDFARLVRAGGTVYWTVNQGVEHSVYAMTPPGPARLLYREHGGTAFGALAPPPHLAVAVDEPATATSRIQLLPRWPGGPVRSLTTPRPIAIGDLLTDGSQLFWADDRGVRATLAAGGPVRTLVRDDAVGDLAVARGRLFYVTGRAVRSVALGGGEARTEVRAANNITALCVSDRIYWSELGVTVQSAGRAHWVGVGGHYTTDIACARSRLVWSDCPPTNTGCQVIVRQGATVGGFTTGPQPRDLDDNGVDIAYVDGGGPGVQAVDPAWSYRPAPHLSGGRAPLRPGLLR